MSGSGPETGWLKYYGSGRRLATRTAQNDLCVMQTNREIVASRAMEAVGEGGDVEAAFTAGGPAFVEPDERPGGALTLFVCYICLRAFVVLRG